jgi:uncharacterized protein YceK
MKRLFVQLMLSFSVVILLSGCATLTKKPQSEIRVNSFPQNARVLLNGLDQGATPLTLRVNRNEYHNVTFLMRGHREVSVQITPKFDFVTTILGNLVSWNILGVVVDLVTGAAYTLTPADVEQHYSELSQLAQSERNPHELFVVLLTQEQWNQIAQRP